MMRIAPGGKGVGGVGINQKQPRHRDTGRVRELIYNRIEFRRVARIERLCAVGAEHYPIRKPVTAEVHYRGEDKKDRDPAASAEQSTDKHQETGHQTKQERCS